MNHDALAIALNDAAPEVRLAAIREVAENPHLTLAEAALDVLIQCLGANRKVIQRRAAEALAASALHDARVVEKLRAMLLHHDSRARWGAAFALGLVNLDDALDLRAMPSLVEALSSSDGDVRWAAAELVVRLGKKNRDAVSNQLIALASSGNLNARKMALYCLRDVGGPREELLAVAESCCGDHKSLLKMAALSLLSRVADSSDRAATLAIHLLESDDDAGVRRCAAVALGHIGNRAPRVTEALTRAANAEGDIYMKRAAQRALTRLGGNA
jgi:HEAT repeat protein